MNSLPKYPSTKPTNSAWIGEVPEHWEVRRLGMLGRFSSSGIDKKIVPGQPMVRMVNYLDIFKNQRRELWNNLDYMEVSCPSERITDHGLIQGDMVFTPSSETAFEVAYSAVVMENLKNTVYSYHTIRYRSTNPMDLYFKKYLCNNYPVLNQFSSLCKGTTRQILTRDAFQSVTVVVPPLPEQTHIARYLDHKTALIDAYLARKRRMITLLKEHRQALISRAVTKGLDPDAPMKHSGIEWIGEVPAHWEVKKLKHLVTYTKGVNAARYTNEYIGENPGLHPVYSGQTDNDGIMGKVDNYDYDHDIGILISTVGARAMSVRLVRGKFSLSQNVALLLSRNAGLDTRYNAAFLDVFFRIEKHRIPHIIQPSLRFEDLDQYSVLYPPSAEQTLIADYLDMRCALIDDELTRIHSSMERVREYRQALISAVVTGKVDVRGVEVPIDDQIMRGSDDQIMEYEEGSEELSMAAEPEE